MLCLRKLSRYITDEVSIIYSLDDYRQEKGRCINTKFIGISYSLVYTSMVMVFDIILNNGAKRIVYSVSDVYPVEIFLYDKTEEIIVIILNKKTKVCINDKHQDMFNLPDRKRFNMYDDNYVLIRKKKLKMTILTENNYEKYFDDKYPINARRIEM
jgi:hypothetical protein